MPRLLYAWGVLWIEPDGLVGVSDGAVIVALGAVGDATVVVGVCILGIEPDRCVVVGDGTVIVALGPVGQAAVVVGPGQITPPRSDHARAGGNTLVAGRLRACILIVGERRHA